MTRILAVDDDDDIRSLLCGLLRIAGYEPQPAPSGIEALALLRDDPLPALVLLDVQMPGLDGWDTLRLIRADQRTAKLPVILCTVKAGLADAELGWSLGCDGYVVKPFGIGEVVAEIRTVLAGDRMRSRVT